MKRTLLLVLVSLLSVSSFAQTRRVARAVAPQTVATRSNAQTLPIRRVILYSNGVAYIERRGTVTGHAEVSLSFKQSQVDDVLKSMVVLDLGQGRIGAVSYNYQTDKPRVVFIEHPVRQDWTLSNDTQKPDGKSARYYRFRVPLGPHQKVELPVTERRVLMDTYTLLNFTRQDLELFITRNYLDVNTRAVLEKIIDIKSRMATAEARVETIDEEVTEIGKDQERLRDNIKALTATAEAKQLISRYVTKADTQETRLEQLNKEKQTLTDDLARLQGELEGLIRGLAIDRQIGN